MAKRNDPFQPDAPTDADSEAKAARYVADRAADAEPDALADLAPVDTAGHFPTTIGGPDFTQTCVADGEPWPCATWAAVNPDDDPTPVAVDDPATSQDAQGRSDGSIAGVDTSKDATVAGEPPAGDQGA